MKHSESYLKLSALALAFATFTPLNASTMPAVTVTAMGGPYFSMWGDAMFPIANKNNQLAYFDLQAEGSDTESGILSAGVGYRRQARGAGIYGLNLFYDRARSSNYEYYNVIGPGVEYLTPSWRYRLNGYFPFGDKDKLQEQGWADDMGNYSYVKFSGHNEYDKLAYQYESLGNGGDATIAYRFQNDKRWEVELSPYVFERKENNTMFGSNLRLNYFEGDNLTLFLGEAYDNANHNRVYVGVTFNFGARNNNDTIDNLMLSPVTRNQNTNTTSDGLPISKFTEYSGENYLEADNVYFVNNSGNTGNQSGEEDGTYEHQYSSLEDVNEIEGDADIRVESTGNSYNSSTTINLEDGQTLSGYESNFRKLATGSNIPTLYAPGYTVTGTVGMSNVTLLNNGDASNTAITVNENSVLNLSDATIGSMSSATSYQTDIFVNEYGTANVTDSTLNAYLEEGAELDEIAIGIMGNGHGTINVSGSVINAQSDAEDTFAAGVFDEGDSTINIDDSAISAFANNAYSKSYGVVAADSTININESSICSVATGEDSASSSEGIEAYGSAVTVTNSVINSSSQTSANGIVAVESAVDIDSSTFNVESEGSAVGVVLYGSSGSVTDSTLNISTTGDNGFGYSWGIANIGESSLTESGNTFNVTGPNPTDIWPTT